MAHVQRKCSGCRHSIPEGSRSCPRCGGRAASWVARYRGPDGRERSRSFTRKVEADQYLSAMENGKNTGEWIDPKLGSITLADFWREQRDRPGVRGKPEPSTIAKWDTIWERYLSETLGDYPLSMITRQDVKDVVTAVPSPWQGAEALKLLRMLLYRAVDASRIKVNPAARIEAPRTKRIKPRILNPAEIEAVVDALPEYWRAFVLLDAYSSLRWSELVALKRDDVDLQGRTVTVDAKVTEVNGRLVWGEPKTADSARTVDLPDAVVGPLAAHLLRFPPVLEADDPRCVGLIFYGETNEPVRRKTFRRVWLKALRGAGIEDHVRVEWLRHSGASLAYAASKDLVAVARRLGHTSTRMVDAVYVDLYGEVSRQVADAIDALVTASRSAEVVSAAGRMRDGDRPDSPARQGS